MFVQMLLMLSQVAFAEPVEDTKEKIDAEINEAEIQAFYEAKKEEDTAITVDMLSEEDFEMDLSALSAPAAIPVADAITAIDTDVELSDMDLSDVDLDVPTASTVPLTPVEDLNWDLDLDEDLEIGAGNLKLAPEPKSEPVNLDFLDEEEEANEE